MKLLMVALFAAMSFALVSCGDDEPENPTDPTNPPGNVTNSDFTFKFNGETYYYGYSFDMGFMTLNHYAGLDVQKDYILLTLNHCQNKPYKLSNEGLMYPSQQDPNASVLDGFFHLEPFDLSTAKKGDKLHFMQLIRPTDNYDVNNYLQFWEPGKDGAGKEYTFREDIVGTVEFVSYQKDDENGALLTLKFNNVTLEWANQNNAYQDWDEWKDKSTKAVINGTITFNDPYL